MEWNYANKNHSTIINEKNGVVYLTFPKLAAAGVRHGFSTRMGGVSKGYLGTMNLSFTRGDREENVRENFRRIADAIGFREEQLVFSAQVHETKIRKVTAANRGEGITKETAPGIDGLATDEADVPLYTSYADCVPLLFYDPQKKVVAMAHSGWRGTAARIGAKMVHFMEKEYGSRAENIIAAVGPSICRKCYEVSEDVAQAFREAFRPEQFPLLFDEKGQGKYQLDLWEANRIILTEAGILPEHLDVTDLCTCCNHDKLFSHRASHGKRGNMGCFMCLDAETE
ncbi:peptidoglycan editing factor PgeF [Eubacterium sp. An3]|uniref:peptidoglycan editing factor PgeF n=1 Tax=Eubacterium sp. An3 TaxID=1965628 RepID=UPI0007A92269|nr:peptidoglycan editing factor PgeF [Eubacterium sp. An3]OUO27515.1 hypothetical protein B5F87_10775 [Eubacterium sp. An3]CVI73907.1 Laccase domain protein [Eubacteriaceae bacterium CHKCI004]